MQTYMLTHITSKSNEENFALSNKVIRSRDVFAIFYTSYNVSNEQIFFHSLKLAEKCQVYELIPQFTFLMSWKVSI